MEVEGARKVIAGIYAQEIVCAGNRSELRRGRQVDDSIVMTNERWVDEDERPRDQAEKQKRWGVNLAVVEHHRLPKSIPVKR